MFTINSIVCWCVSDIITLQELLGKAVKVEEAQVAALQALDKRVQLAEMDHKERKVCSLL